MKAVSLKKRSDCFCSNGAAIAHGKMAESLLLTADQVRGLDDFVLVDVRTDLERENEPLQGFENRESTHRPHHEIISVVFNQEQWPSDKTYVLFCSAGKRSAVAAQWLRDHGVKGAYSMRRS